MGKTVYTHTSSHDIHTYEFTGVTWPPAPRPPVEAVQTPFFPRARPLRRVFYRFFRGHFFANRRRRTRQSIDASETARTSSTTTRRPDDTNASAPRGPPTAGSSRSRPRLRAQKSDRQCALLTSSTTVLSFFFLPNFSFLFFFPVSSGSVGFPTVLTRTI